jgi:hypothetical protein
MDAASDHAPASDGHRSLVDEMGHPSTAQLDLADGAIRDIFSVALVISSARSLSLGPAAARLDVALDDLDGIVRALRRLALTCYPTDSIAPVKDRPDQAMSATAEDALVAQASDALARVDSTLTRLWADAVAVDGHGSSARESIADATHLVRQARLTLTSGVMR